jgi:hypothetical protein
MMLDQPMLRKAHTTQPPSGDLSYMECCSTEGQTCGQAPGSPDQEPAELVVDLRSGTFAPAGIKAASAMNRHGWVAGFEAGPQRTQIPAIAGGGKKLILPMPSGATPAGEVSAASISDDGRIVGGTVMRGGHHTPILWTCRP